jgi:hypothetical protein
MRGFRKHMPEVRVSHSRNRLEGVGGTSIMRDGAARTVSDVYPHLEIKNGVTDRMT